jgi:hypothetical protein
MTTLRPALLSGPEGRQDVARSVRAGTRTPAHECLRSEGPIHGPRMVSALLRASERALSVAALPRSHERGYFLPALRACQTIVALLLATSASAQDSSPAKEPPFTASLLLLKADWSQSPAAKEIEADLRKVWSTEPEKLALLDKSDKIDPTRLFSTGGASIYTQEHYAQLVAWLKARQLFQQVEPFQQFTTPSGDSLVTNFQKDTAFFGMSPVRKQEDPLGAAKSKFTWTTQVWPDEGAIKGLGYDPKWYVYRDLQHYEKDRGWLPAMIANTNAVDGCRTSLAPLEKGHVLIVHAFPGAEDAEYRKAAQLKGFQAFIVFENPPLSNAEAAEPQLMLPDNVERIISGRPQAFSSEEAPNRPPAVRAQSPIPNAAPAASRPPKRSVETTTVSKPDDPRIKVFTLRNLHAIEAERMITELFGREVTSMTADERTNSLIVGGQEFTLNIIYHLLTRLDEPNVEKPSAATSAASSTIPGSGAPNEMLTTVHRLRNTPATEARRMIKQLFGQDDSFLTVEERSNSILTVDERTNSLIVRAPKNVLELILPILTRLDEEPAAESKSPASTRERKRGADKGSSLDNLKRRCIAREEAAQALGARIRAMQPAAPSNQAQIDKITADLQQAVAEAFAARQQLHEAELGQLQQRIAGIQQSLKTRERLSQEIIDRRVKDLLNPDLQWEDSTPRAPREESISRSEMPTMDNRAAIAYRDKLRERWQIVESLYPGGRTSLDTVVRAASELAEAELAAVANADERLAARSQIIERWKQIKSQVQAKFDAEVEPKQSLLTVEAAQLKAEAELPAESGTKRATAEPAAAYPPSASSAPAAYTQTTILRPAEEFADRLRSAEASLNRLNQFDVEDFRDRSDPKGGDLAAKTKVKERAVADAQRKLDFARQEYAAQIRLLELEFRDAQSALQTAQQKYARIEWIAAKNPGALSQSERIEAQRPVDAASLRLERAKTLLDLYRKADPRSVAAETPADDPAGQPK